MLSFGAGLVESGAAGVGADGAAGASAPGTGYRRAMSLSTRATRTAAGFSGGA